jgi:hypothetical protein
MHTYASNFNVNAAVFDRIVRIFDENSTNGDKSLTKPGEAEITKTNMQLNRNTSTIKWSFSRKFDKKQNFILTNNGVILHKCFLPFCTKLLKIMTDDHKNSTYIGCRNKHFINQA